MFRLRVYPLQPQELRVWKQVFQTYGVFRIVNQINVYHLCSLLSLRYIIMSKNGICDEDISLVNYIVGCTVLKWLMNSQGGSVPRGHIKKISMDLFQVVKDMHIHIFLQMWS